MYYYIIHQLSRDGKLGKNGACFTVNENQYRWTDTSLRRKLHKSTDGANRRIPGKMLQIKVDPDFGVRGHAALLSLGFLSPFFERFSHFNHGCMTGCTQIFRLGGQQQTLQTTHDGSTSHAQRQALQRGRCAHQKTKPDG